ncbi:MAG: glycosyltransferase [Alphaproteobacteria bacterium]|nr:glycosyltransferase [Alphaproteobacteria bacterium]
MNTKKRILFLASDMERGEISDYILDVCQFMQKKETLSVVISAGGYETLRLRRYGITHIQAPVHSIQPLSLLSTLSSIYEAIEKYQINVIHAHSRIAGWLAYLVHKKTGVPYVSTVHYEYGLNSIKKSWLERKKIKGLLRADKIITSFPHVQKIIQDLPEVDPQKVFHIPRWVDSHHFSSENISAERLISLTEKWNIPDGLPIILNVSEESEASDIFFLEAIARLPHRQFCILMVRNWAQTNSVLRHRIDKRAKELKIYKNLSIVLPEDDEPLMYKLSDLIICTSSSSFARIALQAQTMGRPVILPAVEGANDFVETRETGHLFLPENIESLTHALSWGLNISDSEREKVISKAKTFSKDYEILRILPQIYKIYNTLF